MYPWLGFWRPGGFPWYGGPGYYPYGAYPYGYPGGAMPKEVETRMLEDQERWLTAELDRIRKRLEELRTSE